MARTKLRDRLLPTYTKGEELFNMISHIVGGGLGIAALCLCVIFSAIKGSISGVLTSVVFGVSMILLYTVSSIYHGLNNNLAKKVFQVLDHCTIYLLIAGTYTPILVCSVAKTSPLNAWITFGVVWGLAALAATLTAIDLKKYSKFSMICYICIGWSIIFSIKETYQALTPAGFFLVLGGGILYSAGTIFYKVGKKKKYFHSIFHLFILGGSICHILCIFFYVILKL